VTWIADTDIVSEVGRDPRCHPGADTAAAAEWGRLPAGRSVPVIDARLAATAGLHGLVQVTGNAANLDGLDVRLLNPFDFAPLTSIRNVPA
jgi:hypothetical protein